ncbi:MAG: EAL domain-containing protein [Betaproteobacteria bacterium]|nr:EAL domain-containing protein [Betaproteobacteria bacterium]
MSRQGGSARPALLGFLLAVLVVGLLMLKHWRETGVHQLWGSSAVLLVILVAAFASLCWAIACSQRGARRALSSLRESEERFRNLTNLSSDWYWEQDDKLRFTFLSTGLFTRSGFADASALGRLRWEQPGIDLASADWESHKAACHAHEPFRDFAYRRTHEDGSACWIAISGEPVIDADGRFRGYRGVASDITHKKRTEQEITRRKDFYAALSHTNRALLHIREPEALFHEVCRGAVEYGHFCLVWIGLLDEQTGWVRQIATDGPASRGCPPIRVSVDPEIPEGRGFSGAVLREGKSYVVNDYFAEARIGPWADQARAAGVKSMATLPLTRSGRCVGVLNLHGDEVGFFTDDLVALLEEMAANISFALTGMQHETEREAAQWALRGSEEKFRLLASSIPEVFWISEPGCTRVIYVSPAYEQMWGRSVEETLANPLDWIESVHPDDRQRVAGVVRQSDTGRFDHEYRIVRPDGSLRWIHDRAFPVLDECGKVMLVTGIAEDITARKETEECLLYLAHYDSLTGLPKRLLFYDRLRQSLAHCKRYGSGVAVMFVDLDRFKLVNDSFGHAEGDRLLQMVAVRLKESLRDGDTAGRLGGDEFAIILSDLGSADDASAIVQKLMHALERPFDLDGHEIFVTVSAGISLSPLDSDDPDVLIGNADVAMHLAKEQGRSCFQYYKAEMNARSIDRLSIENRLRRALERNEFLLHYQPKVDLASGDITGAEALLRWNHPESGLVPPARFIPILEDNGLIAPVGEWVLAEVCRQINAWSADGLVPVPVAVNLSGRQLQQPGLDRRFQRILSESGIDPRLIELEITESVLMRNAEHAAGMLCGLKQLGVRLSVDDFGTGYSSLSYLKSFPLDGLKIDRSFVSDITANPDDAVITRTVIAMAHGLHMKVVAEGVETEEQLAVLAANGCDEMQGYYFSAPVSAGNFVQMVRERRQLRVPGPARRSGRNVRSLPRDEHSAAESEPRTPSMR